MTDTLRAIETRYRGYRFRSRTEARWAVFFDTAGIAYEYEPQGYVLDGRAYLPDFWLPNFGAFFEVKGREPTEEEKDLCEALARASKTVVLLAVGGPSPARGQVFVCRNNTPDWGKKWRIAEEHQDEFLWLANDNDVPMWIGKSHDDDEWIIIRWLFSRPDPRIRKAYEAARSARFEHGETP